MKTLKPIFILLAVAFITACSDNEDPKPTVETDLNEITSITQNGITVTLFATQDFFVGYNAITAKIEDENGGLLNGDISVVPMMHMMNMAHSCPLELPNGETFQEGTFSFNSVFVMPSGEMGSWSIEFMINGTDVTVPVEVSAPELVRLVSFTSMMDESIKYFVAYIDPKDPQVGQNDLEIAVYTKASMMDWPAVAGMEFELEPWMMSMDHGSPNNVAPVHIENGHYRGIVNFTMTGDWQVRLTMMDNGNTYGTPYFDLYFQ